MYIGTAVAAYKAWPVLKDADRAKLILGTIQKALSTIASGGEAWKQYIEYRPFQNGETPANIDTSRFTASGEPTDAERTVAAQHLKTLCLTTDSSSRAKCKGGSRMSRARLTGYWKERTWNQPPTGSRKTGR